MRFTPGEEPPLTLGEELQTARYRLCRSQILQQNMRWKALAEIYTMHSFAPFLESKFEKPGKKNLAETTLEKVKMRSA